MLSLQDIDWLGPHFHMCLCFLTSHSFSQCFIWVMGNNHWVGSDEPNLFTPFSCACHVKWHVWSEHNSEHRQFIVLLTICFLSRHIFLSKHSNLWVSPISGAVWVFLLASSLLSPCTSPTQHPLQGRYFMFSVLSRRTTERNRLWHSHRGWGILGDSTFKIRHMVIWSSSLQWVKLRFVSQSTWQAVYKIVCWLFPSFLVRHIVILHVNILP